MSESIGQRAGHLARHDERELRPLLEAALTDLTALRTTVAACVADITALRTAIVGITAQLDADEGITDTDYASNNDPAAQTSSAPDSLTLTS